MKRTLLLIASIIFSISLIGGVYYMVQQEAEPEPTPAPSPRAKPSPIPQTPEISEITENSCSSTFTVTEAGVPVTCVKHAHTNDPSNTAGNYHVFYASEDGNNEIPQNGTVHPGQILVYNVFYENHSSGTVAGKIVDILPTQVDYMDAEQECSYDQTTRTVTCNFSLSNSGQVDISLFRVKVKGTAAAGEMKNTATVEITGVGNSTCLHTVRIVNEDLISPSPSPSTSPSPSPSASATPRELSCAKRAWKDEATNRADQYTYLTGIQSAKPGDTVVYELAYSSTGLSFVDVTDVLDSKLQFIDSSDECSYSTGSRTLSCHVDFAGKDDGAVLFRARVADSATVGSKIPNKATAKNVDHNLTSNCEVEVGVSQATVYGSPKPTTAAQASPIPSELPEAGIMTFTTGAVGIGVLLLLLGLVGILLI